MDAKEKGTLAADYLQELLTTKGDALSKKEMKAIMRESKAGADGFLAYMGNVWGHDFFNCRKTERVYIYTKR